MVNQAGVQIGVDGHLFTRHGVEGKARAHFGDPFAPFGDHHEVDDHQDDEHHNTDHVVAADHHFTEGLDHLTGGVATFVTVEQYHARRGHVQAQT